MISSLLCLSLFQMSTLLFSETPAANQKTGKGSKNFSFLKQAIEQNQESLKEYLAADHQEVDQCVTVVQDVQSIVATDRFVPPRLANSMKGPQRNERQSKYRSLQWIIDKKKRPVWTSSRLFWTGILFQVMDRTQITIIIKAGEKRESFKYLIVHTNWK